MDFPIIGYDKYSRIAFLIILFLETGPVKESMSPEDQVLFADLDESEKSSLINETPDSWLRFMEYGSVSTNTKQPSHSSQPSSPRSAPASTKKERIEQSFAPIPLTRPDNPNVVAEAVWEVLPDEVSACFDYRLVVGSAARVHCSASKTTATRRTRCTPSFASIVRFGGLADA